MLCYTIKEFFVDPHSYLYTLPLLVGVSKTTLDNKLGLANYKWDFKNILLVARTNKVATMLPAEEPESELPTGILLSALHCTPAPSILLQFISS